MKILVLNGSLRSKGAAADMVDAFSSGASDAGHQVAVTPVARKNIHGCLGCEYCQNQGQGRCVQQDDMQEIYSAILSLDMLGSRRSSEKLDSSEVIESACPVGTLACFSPHSHVLRTSAKIRRFIRPWGSDRGGRQYQSAQWNT